MWTFGLGGIGFVNIDTGRREEERPWCKSCFVAEWEDVQTPLLEGM
jgi:hypothetical protein